MNFETFINKFSFVNSKFVKDFYNIIKEDYIERYNEFLIDSEILRYWLDINIKRNFSDTIKKSYKKGFTHVFSMNCTSDISFEKYEVLRNGQSYTNIFTAFPEVQFYDYTKILGRKVKNISNYHLTFSAADGNDADVYRAIAEGYNVATVFGLKKTEPMPETYLGRTVFNGDDSDLRFLDPKNVVVGLYAKGKAKKDTSGFVKYPTFMMKAA
jgi:hypothetical protein